MKFFLAISIFIITSTLYADLPKYSVIISSSSSNLQLGKAPKINVQIINNTNKSVYFVKSLEASYFKARYPHSTFIITSPTKKTQTPNVLICGNMKSLMESDFKKIAAKSVFSPYGSSITSSIGLMPYDFNKPGNYKVTYHYSSIEKDITKWLGDKAFNWKKNKDLKLIELFNKVPKISLTSNTLEFKVLNDKAKNNIKKKITQ